MAIARKAAVIAVAILMVVSGAMAGMDLCGVNEDSLTACKPWVTKPCPTELPSAVCCDGLSKADFGCFCNYKHSLLLPSLGIDPDLALALPAKCSLPNAPSC